MTLLRCMLAMHDAIKAHAFKPLFILIYLLVYLLAYLLVYLLVYAAIIPSKVDFKLVFCALTLPTKLSMAANCWL